MKREDAGLAALDLTKRFDDVEPVAGVTLEVGRGELVALLGSSGAGKSTILRLIAGHLEPDAGEVWIGGEPMEGIPPEKRNVGMVFQSYALFPHLNLRRNVAFGPQRRGESRRAARRIADEMLARVGLADLAGRMPREISGGEAQRAAVARALAIRPDVLLLDEPLSSLDAALRRDLRTQLAELQREFAATTVWVTHDQEEALTVADRVAVLHEGTIQQIASPLELHTRPANRFVAAFVGKMNLLPATATGAGGRFRIFFDGPSVRAATDDGGDPPAAGTPVMLGIRPEVVQIGHPPASPGFNSVAARVVGTRFLGDRLEMSLEIPGGRRLLARGNSLFGSLAREGDAVRAHWPIADTRVFPGRDASTRGLPGRDA